MKSRDELMTKAEELVSKDSVTPVDQEAAAILIALAGYDEDDFVTEFGAMGMLDDYKRENNSTVQEAVEIVERFLF